MKKLIEEYQKMICENQKYPQHIIDFYKGIMAKPKNFGQYKMDYLEMAKHIFLESINDDNNIILETGEAYENIFSKIYNGPNEQTYTHDEFSKFINKSWNKYDLFIKSNDKLNLVIIKVNFDDTFQLAIYAKKFKIFTDKYITINECKQLCIDKFSNANGIAFETKTDFIVFLNTKNKLTMSTIKHEITHYLQRILRGSLSINDLIEQHNRETDAYFSINIPLLLNKLYYSFYKDTMNKHEFLTNYIKSSFIQNETDFDKELKEKLKSISDKRNDIALLMFLKNNVKSQTEKFKLSNILSNNFLKETK